jgi:superfamily II DNA/RNA helicase
MLQNAEKSSQGVQPMEMALAQLRKELKKRLKLGFEPEPWQAMMVKKILEGHDAVYVAGTGRGKSLVWEGVAAMAKRRGRLFLVVVVIEPLRSIQEDMVSVCYDINADSDNAPYQLVGLSKREITEGHCDQSTYWKGSRRLGERA